MFGDHTLSRSGDSDSQDRLLLVDPIIPSVEVSDLWSIVIHYAGFNLRSEIVAFTLQVDKVTDKS
jgi:hypothetical protein